MIYLILVSIIWSLSFTLIKGNLTSIDPYLVSFIRLFISFIIFLPFLRISKLRKEFLFRLLVLGFFQYGLMYLAYIYSYKYLKAYQIALLTIFTPIFVVLINDIWNKKFIGLNWLKALLTIMGSGIIVYTTSFSFGFWKGIVLIQVSNFLFALGQVYYKKLVGDVNFKEQLSNYAVVFLGAAIITFIFAMFSFNNSELNIETKQWFTLLYLGIIASGLAFYLWNYGATKVKTGNLAIMNNLKIPLGILFAVLLLGEDVNLLQLIIGSTIIISAFFLERLSINEKQV
ncbi:MAG: EamA family transporter [Ignavibacteriae bacterium]|nr:MAG: EamA family transporter [Ignavibacteriota bacterium]